MRCQTGGQTQLHLRNKKLRPGQPPHQEEPGPHAKRDQETSDVFDSPTHHDTHENEHRERKREAVRLSEEEQNQNCDERTLHPDAGPIDDAQSQSERHRKEPERG